MIALNGFGLRQSFSIWSISLIKPTRLNSKTEELQSDLKSAG